MRFYKEITGVWAVFIGVGLGQMLGDFSTKGKIGLVLFTVGIMLGNHRQRLSKY